MQDTRFSDKTRLRKALRAQRRGLSPKVQHATARTVAETALGEAHFPLGQHIALFSSADGEVDTGPMLDALLARGKARPNANGINNHSPGYRYRMRPEPYGSGGGSSDVSGFPSCGHAHNAIGQSLRVTIIGSRTNSTGQYPREIEDDYMPNPEVEDRGSFTTVAGNICVPAAMPVRFRSGDWTAGRLRSCPAGP